jgi:hypothetical protein
VGAIHAGADGEVLQVIHNMLSCAECAHLVELAQNIGMENAFIHPHGSYTFVQSTSRTNTQARSPPLVDLTTSSKRMLTSAVSAAIGRQCCSQLSDSLVLMVRLGAGMASAASPRARSRCDRG